MTQYGIQENGSGLTVLRCNVHHTVQAIAAGDVDLESSYVHDLVPTASSYTLYVSGGGGSVTIRGNAILNQTAAAAAISLTTDYGPETNVTVAHNLVAGGSYVVDGGAGPGSHDIRVTDNHFSRRFFPNGGGAGPVVRWDGREPGNVWSGNVWDETAAPVPPPR